MSKLFRKSISILLSFAVLLSFASTSFASTTDGLEKAILNAKSKITIPAEYSEFDSDIRLSPKVTEYDLAWRTQDGEKRINLTINDKNDITQYFISSSASFDDSVKFSAFSADELKQKALSFIEKINPSWTSELDIDNAYITGEHNIYSDRTHIEFKRVKDKSEFLGNYVSLSLSNQSGNVINMYSYWDYADYIPKKDLEVLDADAASDSFFKASPLELIYTNDDNGEAKLVYRITKPSILLNAVTGEEIKRENYLYNSNMKEEAIMDSASGGSSNGLTEAEIKNLGEIDSLLSESGLVKIAKSLKNTGLDKAEFKSCQYTRGYGFYPKSDEEPSDYLAELSFIFNKGGENEYTAHVALDAKSGKLMRYSAYDYILYSGEIKAPDISNEVALKSATEFMASYTPYYSDKVKVDNRDLNNGSKYNFNFVRYENDIPYYNNSISVSVNSQNGLISSFYYDWDDTLTFEATDGILSMENAQNFFNQNIGLETVYAYDYTSSDEGVVTLCYRAKQVGSFMLSAKTGELTNINLDTEAVMPTDISGHYAEDKITALINAGVIQINKEDKAYRPDDSITYGELSALVCRLSQRYHYYEPAMAEQALRSAGVLLENEEFKPDATAVRADGAVYIVRAIGYRSVAELSHIFVCYFNDSGSIPQDIIGYIAIANGLNIVRGDENNCFNPASPLSRADAAIMIYNYLSR